MCNGIWLQTLHNYYWLSNTTGCVSSLLSTPSSCAVEVLCSPPLLLFVPLGEAVGHLNLMELASHLHLAPTDISLPLELLQFTWFLSTVPMQVLRD